ncbi:CMD1 [Symbiodinium sp. KB8]|nr:CMD1 [Symbiodinium sp. KB8]
MLELMFSETLATQDELLAEHSHPISFCPMLLQAVVELSDSAEDEANLLKPTAFVVSGGGGGITSEAIPSENGEDDQYGFMDLTVSKHEIKITAVSHGGQIRNIKCLTQRLPGDDFTQELTDGSLCDNAPQGLAKPPKPDIAPLVFLGVCLSQNCPGGGETLWVDDSETPENQISQTASVENPGGTYALRDWKYPPAFVAYLARLLLARDERCAGWWAGAKSAALIKRFGGRFPFDAEPQIRLCFGLLPEDVLRGSFFDQNFSTDRDEVMEVFLAIDKDGNGMLTRAEIQEAFQSIGDGWLSKPEVEQMLKDALADSNGEVDVAGFKAALAKSLTAPRARAEQGLPDAEWWRDPAALLPAPMLETATPAVLQEAYEKYRQGGGIQAQPLQREKPLNLRTYALFTLAGRGATEFPAFLLFTLRALACTLTHVALVPLDVVKTLQQTEPSRFGSLGLLTAGHRLVKVSPFPGGDGRIG